MKNIFKLNGTGTSVRVRPETRVFQLMSLVRQKRRSTTAITDVLIGRRFPVRDKERDEYYHPKF